MLSTLLLFARGAVVLAFALVAVRLLRRSPATLRYLVLATALVAVLALPLIEGALPTWHTGAITATAVTVPIQAEVPLADLGGAPVAAPSPVVTAPADVEIPWTSIAGGLWLLGLSIALLRVGYGAVRARMVAHRAGKNPGLVAAVEMQEEPSRAARPSFGALASRRGRLLGPLDAALDAWIRLRGAAADVKGEARCVSS